MSDLETAYHEAFLALPDSVSGDAAPENATLADRIRALTMERDHARRGMAECHAKHFHGRAALVRTLDLIRAEVSTAHTAADGTEDLARAGAVAAQAMLTAYDRG